jgi:CRP-like cAMP-binding protein
VSIIQGDNKLISLGTGDFFGALPILEDNRCTTTVKATTKGSLLVIPRPVFRQKADRTTIGKRLLKLHQMRPALLECGWVKDLPVQIIDRLAEKVNRRTFALRMKEKREMKSSILRGRANVFMIVNGQSQKITSMAKNQSLPGIATSGSHWFKSSTAYQPIPRVTD